MISVGAEPRRNPWTEEEGWVSAWLRIVVVAAGEILYDMVDWGLGWVRGGGGGDYWTGMMTMCVDKCFCG